jgi:PST family polysaccharide transporter
LKPFDANGAFQAGADQRDLGRLAVRGAGATVFSGGLGLAIQVIATMILARLVTPADFGVVTMVTTFSLLLLNFGLNGFTEAIVQREEIDRFLASNLFWINSGVGLLLTIGFAAAGSLMARFYANPLVARVAVGVSLAIILTSLGVLHLALLKRAMRFSTTSAIEVSSRIASMAVSILLAWAGLGYWALVAGIVAQAAAQTTAAWILCSWVPSLPRRAVGTASAIKFATNVYGRFIVNYISRNTDNLLVGWRFNAQALGFYKKAYDLFALSAGQLTSPITIVAVSALSRFDPRSREYRRHLLNSVSVMSLLAMGLAVNLTFVGKDLIRLLLGPGWQTAGRIFTFFGPGIGIMVIYYMHGWIHLSIGRADRWLRWGIIEAAVTCLFFVIALPWGPQGIAVAWTASFWILAIPAFWYAGKPIDFGVGPVLAIIWKYAVASLLAGCACAGILREIPFMLPASSSVSESAARIFKTSALFGFLYLGLVVLFHLGGAPLYQVVRLFNEMISSAGPLAVSQAEATTRAIDSSGALVPEWARSKPLVSILIPAFNAQESIADTVRSAIAQSWEPKEIIVVDDGSTDRTLAIARQFESDSVQVFTQENQGAAATRNKAFSLSRGDYIQWLDADDLLAPDKIARQMKVLAQCRSKRTLLSSAYGRFRYRPYAAKFIPTPLWCDLSPVEWLLRKLGHSVYMQTATWLVSRELSEAAGPWNTAMLSDDDGEYFCRVLLASDGVRFVPDAKVYYRAPWVDTLSYIGTSKRKVDAHWLSIQLHIRYIRSLEDSERVRNACLRYLQSCLDYFYPDRPDIVKQVEQLARELGGQLGLPYLPRKYYGVRLIFGWGTAERLQLYLLRTKWVIAKSWDRVLLRIHDSMLTQDFPE